MKLMQQNQLFRIQLCASDLGSNEVMDHLQLFVEKFQHTWSFQAYE